MTATAHPLGALPPRSGSRSRTLNVVRLQLINTQSFLWVPLLILAAAVVVSVLIFAMIPESDGPMYAGAANAPMWYFLALGIQAMTLSFPFSQAMSVTRREFFLGTLIVGAIGAAMMATLFVAVAGIEQLTNGYGVNGYVARLDWLFEPGWASAWLSYFAFTLGLFVIGFWAATIWKRFGTFTIVAVGVGLGITVMLAIFFITTSGSWPQVIMWFAERGALQITLIGLAATAVLSAGAWLTLRRATV